MPPTGATSAGTTTSICTYRVIPGPGRPSEVVTIGVAVGASRDAFDKKEVGAVTGRQAIHLADLGDSAFWDPVVSQVVLYRGGTELSVTVILLEDPHGGRPLAEGLARRVAPRL